MGVFTTMNDENEYGAVISFLTRRNWAKRTIYVRKHGDLYNTIETSIPEAYVPWLSMSANEWAIHLGQILRQRFTESCERIMVEHGGRGVIDITITISHESSYETLSTLAYRLRDMLVEQHIPVEEYVVPI